MDNDAKLFMEHSNDMSLQFLKNFQSLFPFGKQVIIFSIGTVVTHSPPTSEVRGGGLKPRFYGRKLVVAYRWPAVYSTEP